MASAIGADEFGLRFMGARRVGVEEFGTEKLVVAASALVEKGQNALARFGRNAAADRTATSPSMRKCWLDLMGNVRGAVGLS